MKEKVLWFQLIATVILAGIVMMWTNVGVDILVLSWIVGAVAAFFPVMKGYPIALGITSIVIAGVLILSPKMEWGWLDYTIVIERLISVIVVARELWVLRDSGIK